MNILLLYTPRESTPFREHVEPDQLEQMARALAARGWHPAIAEYAPGGLRGLIASHSPELVFNLAYGYVDRARQISESQADVARQLEAHGLNAVGSDSTAQSLAQDKVACDYFLRAHGIASPRLLDWGCPENLSRIAVRKPRYGACHRDVSLVEPGEALSRDAGDGEFLLQEYIDGPELTVSVVDLDGHPRALPPIEFIFQTPDSPHILIPKRFQWETAVDLHDRFGLCGLAERAFTALRMRDYARFDFRVAAEGPRLLDANSLPNLHPARSFLPRAAEAAGIPYEDLIHLLASQAARRGSLPRMNRLFDGCLA